MDVQDLTWLSLDLLAMVLTATRYETFYSVLPFNDLNSFHLFWSFVWSYLSSVKLMMNPNLCQIQLWLGGTPNQTSLAQCFLNKVKIQELEKVLEPLFYHWKRNRKAKESFGDFSNRVVSSNLKKDSQTKEIISG